MNQVCVTHAIFSLIKKQGNRSGIREVEPVLSNSPMSNSLSSSVSTSYNDDIDTEDNYQVMSKYPSSLNYPRGEDRFENNNMGGLMNSNFLPATNEYQGAQLSDPGLNYAALYQKGSVYNNENNYKSLDLESWEEVFEHCTKDSRGLPSQPVIPTTLLAGNNENYHETFSQLLDVGSGINSTSGGSPGPYISQRNDPIELVRTEFPDTRNISVGARQPLLGSIKAEEGLQKVDSFSKWMTKELDGVDDLQLKSSSNLSWQNIETATDVDDPSIQLENYSMSPSIGQDQLFDIHDFSPSCASMETETKVVISGKFLVNPSEINIHKWSCMFGEVEVPAEVIGNGILCCYAPPHNAGRVPFYVTCSNRFACSQVREFEFLVESQDVNSTNTVYNGVKEKQLLLQLETLLSTKSSGNLDSYNYIKQQPIVNKIFLLMEDELCLGVENHLKEKLISWLLDKVSEDGKGPNIVDEKGQGLLHLAAALGFDWIIPATLVAGVSVNFRDVNGWTALHWAGFFGREKTVALLVSLGAASGALTDPTPESPLGRTAADLASANGYKGISGFLAEHSLTAHLETLTMGEQTINGSLANSIGKAVQTLRDKVATPDVEGDGSDLPLKDSLAAVRNATQAAGRIHQVFRMQSMQRKQTSDPVGDDESLLMDERLLSLVSSKKPGHSNDIVHSAAVQIQKKYRGWKKRKEFLIIRERVVRIQAHVRGHQVRKRYKTVVWSVGILEKVILRWRRKGTGLRGFRPDALKAPIPESKPPEDDDYDYLKEGRKQTEERLQKALFRVKSMVQYPEGRAQYRRLLTAVEGFQKNQQQAGSSMLSRSEIAPAEGEDDMIDVESLFDNDNFMAIAFE